MVSSMTKKALELGACENDLDSYLDDGYYQDSNETLCLIHPEILWIKDPQNAPCVKNVPYENAKAKSPINANGNKEA